MRHLRVHVGPEAVLVALYGGPERRRALVGELAAPDTLDVLEAVFPLPRAAQRRAALLHDQLAVASARAAGQLVERSGPGDAPALGSGFPRRAPAAPPIRNADGRPFP